MIIKRMAYHSQPDTWQRNFGYNEFYDEIFSYDKGNIENVFSWKPIVNQWWITGFNVKYTEPDSDKMVTIGKIDLSEHKDLYYSFAKSTEYQYIDKENLVFDSINKCIYVIWYNEEYVK